MKQIYKNEIINILQASPYAFAKIDSNLNILYYNPSFEFLTQNSNKNLINKNICLVFPDFINQRIDYTLRKCLKKKNAIEFKYKINKNKILKIKASPYKNFLHMYFTEKNIKVSKYIQEQGVTVDSPTNIVNKEDTLKKIIAERKETLALLNSLLTYAPVGFAFFDKNHRYVVINQHLSSINGIKKEDHINSKIENLLPINSKLVVPLIDKVFKTKSAYSGIELEGETPLKPGKKRYWLTDFYPVFSDAQVIYVGIVVVEITSRKNAEMLLLASERKFRNIYDSNMIGITFAKFTGEVVEANDAFLNMLGYSRKELHTNNLNLNKLTPLKFKKASKESIKNLKETGVTTPFEKEYYHKNGNPISVIKGSALLEDVQNADYVTYILNISDRKKLEKQKDEFLGIASHELKTPLTSIQAYLQLLERNLENKDYKTYSEYLKKTNVQIKKLNMLISDLLDVSRIQLGKIDYLEQDIDVNTLIRDCIDFVQPISSTHNIIFKNTNTLKIIGDRNRIEQVLINILSNAIKYSPEANKVLVSSKIVDNVLSISIRDYGIGIAEKSKKDLFKRFYRTKESEYNFSGMGIGLYIANEIVKRHGGNIELKSILGKGSTFVVNLPLKNAKTI